MIFILLNDVLFHLVVFIIVNGQNVLYLSKYEKKLYLLLLDEVFHEYQLYSID